MTIPELRQFTSARVSLGRCGNSLPTAELLKLQLAEVRARQAVRSGLDVPQLTRELSNISDDVVVVYSAASDRVTYIRRPDLGRRLNDDSRYRLDARRGQYDVVFAMADGLSSIAVHLHAKPLLGALLPLLDKTQWRIAPLVVVEQGRVAIADEIGESLGASLSVLLIGERPGLSASDSLGAYLTWSPRSGLTDAHRNCISNIRQEGLSYEVAAHRLAFLMIEARRRRLSGFGLKEDAKALTGPAVLITGSNAAND